MNEHEELDQNEIIEKIEELFDEQELSIVDRHLTAIELLNNTATDLMDTSSLNDETVDDEDAFDLDDYDELTDDTDEEETEKNIEDEILEETENEKTHNDLIDEVLKDAEEPKSEEPSNADAKE